LSIGITGAIGAGKIYLLARLPMNEKELVGVKGSLKFFAIWLGTTSVMGNIKTLFIK
jgi:hypothetical protein